MLPEPTVHGGRRIAAVGLLALVLLAGVPSVGAHGNDDGHGAATTGAGLEAAGAFPVAEREGDHDQRNPAVDGSLVVWQERVDDGHRGWDIFGANLTTRTTFTIMGQAGDQVDPVVDGSHVAWIDRSGGTPDVVLMDLEEGRLRVLAGSDAFEQNVRIAWPYVVWTVRDGTGSTIAAYDLDRQQHVHLPGGLDDVREVDTWGGHIVYYTRQNSRWRLYDWTEANGHAVEIANGTGQFSSISASDMGVVYMGRSDGVVAHFIAWGSSEPRPLQTSITPHANVQACEGAAVWDQGSTLADAHGVAYWDLTLHRSRVFVPGNYEPDCSRDWIVYEKRGGDQRAVYALDVETHRPTIRPEIVADDGMFDRIVQSQTSFSGSIVVHDERNPPLELEALVDGAVSVPIDLLETADGTLRWRASFDATRLSAGEHRLSVLVRTVRGDTSERSIRFFADTEGTAIKEEILRSNAYEAPEPTQRGFFEGLAHHYEVYARFYNSLAVVLIVLFYLGRALVRHLRERPKGRPEFVRADDP